MKVLVGVCGGIAAYRAAEVVRALQDYGATVEVATTASAERFVTSLTFRALTGRPVYTSLWEPVTEPLEGNAIEHIAVAQQIDALLVLPATAHTLARLAHGLADDFLSAVYLATKAPVLIAPAMNVNMWEHPATQENVRMLKARGNKIIEPDIGYLACGMTGAGRLANVERITNETVTFLKRHHDLTSETVLITAGGTREPLDPVRFLGNRSSGRMGYALAEAAAARGARVILISASPLPAPVGCELLRTETAGQMQSAMQKRLAEATIVIGAAAVADFRPTEIAETKLRRTGSLLLALEPTPDLLAEAVRHRPPGTLIIAFAAETENLEANARAKLLRKGVNAIVANDVSEPGIGFDSERNAGLFLTPTMTTVLEEAPKRILADHVLDQITMLRTKRER